MILCIMCYDIYMSNLTLKSTQKLLLNFISTIDNNEAAVKCILAYFSIFLRTLPYSCIILCTCAYLSVWYLAISSYPVRKVHLINHPP